METNFLFQPFIEAMNEIGEHGFNKHPNPINFSEPGSPRPAGSRWSAEEIRAHAAEHFNAYLRGELHDHFGDLGHQLAASAFNSMMAYYFYTQESVRRDEAQGGEAGD